MCFLFYPGLCERFRMSCCTDVLAANEKETCVFSTFDEVVVCLVCLSFFLLGPLFASSTEIRAEAEQQGQYT